MMEMDVTFSESITKRYEVQNLIGSGGFGCVYAATRKDDRTPVALKRLRKERIRYSNIPGLGDPVPIEVQALQSVCESPQCPQIINLIEWINEDDHVVLVMERPDSCQTLSEFVNARHGHVSELAARIIIKQLVLAAKHCEERRVFHRDIKPKNVLIDAETLRIKLVDFGSADFIGRPYRTITGTLAYYPPEYFKGTRYYATPSTVWTLGTCLYVLMHGKLPFASSRAILFDDPTLGGNLSSDCKDLIAWCLQKKQDQRPSLDRILGHRWICPPPVIEKTESTENKRKRTSSESGPSSSAGASMPSLTAIRKEEVDFCFPGAVSSGMGKVMPPVSCGRFSVVPVVLSEEKIFFRPEPLKRETLEAAVIRPPERKSRFLRIPNFFKGCRKKVVPQVPEQERQGGHLPSWEDSSSTSPPQQKKFFRWF